jgi:membrane protease YdiL (CAAX protease family)
MGDLEIEKGKSDSGSQNLRDDAFAVATAPPYAQILFWGPDGLRPGWGFAFYVVAYLALQSLAIQLVGLRDFGDSGLWSMLLVEVGNFLAAAIPALVLARIERRPWAAYGLPIRQAFGRRFWAGALWGFLSISLVMLAIYSGHSYLPGHIILHRARLLRFAAFWGTYFVIVGLYEDFLFRGYSQFTLARGIGFWPAAGLLAASFGLVHRGNVGENWSGLLLAALIGLFFCLTLQRTGTLWFAIGFHAAWDWGESFFYSVPDSGTVVPGHLLNSTLHGPVWLTGGSVGPEGSVVCFLVIVLISVTFNRLYPRSASSAPGTVPPQVS